MYKYSHSRMIEDNYGVAQFMPIFSFMMIFFLMANSGLPGTSGFVGEFLVIASSLGSSFLFGFLAATSLILSASYSLKLGKNVYLVKIMTIIKVIDCQVNEKIVLATLIVFVLYLGISPNLLFNLLDKSVNDIIASLSLEKHTMIELLVIPEIILSLGLLFVIIIDLYLQNNKYFTYLLIQLLIIVAHIIAVVGNYFPVYLSYEFSTFTNLIKIILLISVLIIFHYTYKHLEHLNNIKIEYFTISLLSLIGTMVMISAYSLLMLYLGIELLSLALYALIGFNKNSGLASEAAIKYYVLGLCHPGYFYLEFHLFMVSPGL